jgi:hypothetical protein
MVSVRAPTTGTAATDAPQESTISEIVHADWRDLFKDTFDRIAGVPLPRGPLVADASPPAPEDLASAKALMSAARLAVFTHIESLPEAVAEKVVELAPSSPVIEQVLRQISPVFEKAVIDKLYALKGTDWMGRLTLPAREVIVDLLTRGIVGATDRAVYDVLIRGVHDDRFRNQSAMLDTPQGRAIIRERAKSLGTESTVNYRGVDIAIDGPAPVQLAIRTAYEGVEAKDRLQSIAPDAAMARPLSKSARTGLTARLPGTTLWRPGLANMSPSASSLFRMAQYTDKLVLAYTCTDNDDASRLRPLTEYRGVPVPQELRGKLFAIGTPDHRYQDERRGAGVLISQLAELARDGASFQLDTSNLNAIAHSQGNKEVLLARETLAANGFPDVITWFGGLAPATRGSFFANSGTIVEAARAGGGAIAADAVLHLRTDYSEATMPEYLRSTVDMAMLGNVQTALKPAIHSPFMSLANLASNKDLSGSGSDGLVDMRVSDYVKDPSKFYVASKAWDHHSIITDPEAIDEFMTHVEPTDPKTIDVLRALARRD